MCASPLLVSNKILLIRAADVKSFPIGVGSSKKAARPPGLRQDQVEEFLSEFEPARQTWPGIFGIPDVIRRREAPDPTGQLIGFDVLGIAYGEFHSWFCHSLEEPIAAELGIRTGAYGLLPTWSEANARAEYASRLEVGAEPVPWYAWAVISYPI